MVIHRAIYGSFERFIAILIEHFAGAFPAWLAPVQARVVTVSDRFNDWAAEVAARLEAEGFRVELDHTSEKLGAKIRDAQLQKIPFTAGGRREGGRGEGGLARAAAAARISRPCPSTHSSSCCAGKARRRTDGPRGVGRTAR